MVIGHRGAPGYRPEHTLSSYRLAIALGADAVEPDLVMTSDGVVVIRHENEISGTTDVAAHAEFAERRTTKTVDGHTQTGWFTEDFTLAELKSLRAVERLPQRRPRNTRWDGRHEVATFDELLLLLAEEQRRWGRSVGLVAELKSPSYFAGLGLDLEASVLAALHDHGWHHRDSGVVLESFDAAAVRRLCAETDLRVVQLVDETPDYDAMCTHEGLRELGQLVDGVSFAKCRVLDRPALVDEAHLAGLQVLVFTVRDDDPAGRPLVDDEVRVLLDAGVDGLFSDHPDTTVLIRDDWAAGRLSGRVGAAPRPA
jgi:glycerophosphoryl diester phosphodiesterase